MSTLLRKCSCFCALPTARWPKMWAVPVRPHFPTTWRLRKWWKATVPAAGCRDISPWLNLKCTLEESTALEVRASYRGRSNCRVFNSWSVANQEQIPTGLERKGKKPTKIQRLNTEISWQWMCLLWGLTTSTMERLFLDTSDIGQQEHEEPMAVHHMIAK